MIKQRYSHALEVNDDIKVIDCRLLSKKGLKKIYRYRPDLQISLVEKHGNIYTVTIENNGTVMSKSCYLVIKIGKLIRKTKIESLEGFDGVGNGFTFGNLEIPRKYANKKYTKIAIIDYYNQNKEDNKKNNIYTFKF